MQIATEQYPSQQECLYCTSLPNNDKINHVTAQTKSKEQNNSQTKTKQNKQKTNKNKQQKSNPHTHMRNKNRINRSTCRYGWKETWQKTGTTGTAQIKEEQTKTTTNLQIRLEDS